MPTELQWEHLHLYSYPLLLPLSKFLIFPPIFLLSNSILLVWQHNSKVEPVIENGNSYPETKTISTQNGSEVGTQDKDIVVEGFGSVEVYDQWIAPPVSGGNPKARYEVLALVNCKNYIIPFFTSFVFYALWVFFL